MGIDFNRFVKMIKLQFSQKRTNVSITLVSIGVIGLLSTACAYSSYIPAGDASYQWLWCGWTSIIFAVCILLAVGISAKSGVHFFYHSVIWGLIFMGGIEAVWGLRQIYGFATSNHSLYAVTGSFYNPGPYSGYLALVFPICLHEWLRLGAIKQRTWKESIGYYCASGVLLLLVCILPAGMSRSAWLAAVFSGVFVCGTYYWNWLKKVWGRHRQKVQLALFLLFVILMVGGIGIYHLKADSAKGRLFMWKISSLAISKKPISAYGLGNFVYAYGQEQEAYFAEDDYDEDEERVAGSPEYAFNEYLRIAVEGGIPVLVLVLVVLGGCLYQGYRKKRIGICGGLISLLVFSFFSYPMAYPCFVITLILLLVACFLDYSYKLLLLFVFVVGVAGVYLVRNNAYDACREWTHCRMLYNNGAYSRAEEGYGRLYSLLKDRPRFLFEYGRCLHKLKEYDSSNRILQKAERLSCDPMILNIIGKNYQALEAYEKAEEYLIRSTHRLPGRIYPYYLLAKLYAEPGYYQPDRLRDAVEIVLTKEPKVQSTAIREMREEVRKLR